MDASADRPARPPVRRCAGCHGPLDPDLPDDTHPCCDPVHGRTVTRWADILHNDAVRARANTARAALHAR